MSVSSFLGFSKSDEEKRAESMDSKKAAQDAQNAIALSNYRQTSKDQNDQEKNNRYAAYAPFSQRLQAAYGQGMVGPQASPVTLADTGVGAAPGSNFTGWDSLASTADSANGGHNGSMVHHTGIGEYLNGTAQAPGTESFFSQGEQGDGYAGTRHYTGTTVDAVQGGVPQTVAPSYMPGSAQVQQPTAQAPGTPYSFFPGGR